MLNAAEADGLDAAATSPLMSSSALALDGRWPEPAASGSLAFSWVMENDDDEAVVDADTDAERCRDASSAGTMDEKPSMALHGARLSSPSSSTDDTLPPQANRKGSSCVAQTSGLVPNNLWALASDPADVDDGDERDPAGRWRRVGSGNMNFMDTVAMVVVVIAKVCVRAAVRSGRGNNEPVESNAVVRSPFAGESVKRKIAETSPISARRLGCLRFLVSSFFFFRFFSSSFVVLSSSRPAES